jgi:hypothetical protein
MRNHYPLLLGDQFPQTTKTEAVRQDPSLQKSKDPCQHPTFEAKHQRKQQHLPYQQIKGGTNLATTELLWLVGTAVGGRSDALLLQEIRRTDALIVLD